MITEKPIEPWRRVWRVIAGHLPFDGLENLAVALEKDDPHLVQGTLVRTFTDTVTGGCAIGFCYNSLETGSAKATMLAFSELRDIVENSTGEDILCHFTNWFDQSMRDDARRELLPEVQRELERRIHSAR